ncbi:hypothetical protein VMCG_01170 [Cytospora schulzeri]|uniref:Uncharacterized protein n=1 Tax=Cytospora schulzeri TaxID=448051 RepID=A0A423X5B1_9PEZI|nr:hypothetical protein VMCG_01170 [Valsa malicola]
MASIGILKDQELYSFSKHTALLKRNLLRSYALHDGEYVAIHHPLYGVAPFTKDIQH